MLRFIIASLLIANVAARCSTEGCNCCCYGDTAMPMMGMASGSGSGMACVMRQVMGQVMGQSMLMCCPMNVNSIEIEFNANIEDGVAAGNVDGNQLAGDVVAFLVDLGVPVEDIIDIQYDEGTVIVVISEDNDPDTVMALQSTVNDNIGNFGTTATTAVASAGTTSFNPVSTGTDAQGKQITLLEFCEGSSKKGKKSKGKDGKKGNKKGKGMEEEEEEEEENGGRQRRGKKGKDNEDEEEDMEGRMSSGDEMEGRMSSGSEMREGRQDNCIPLPRTTGKGKKDKKGKKGYKGSLTSFFKSGSSGMKVTAAMFIGIGCAVLAVALRRYKKSASKLEITEESPLLDVEQI